MKRKIDINILYIGYFSKQVSNSLGDFRSTNSSSKTFMVVFQALNGPIYKNINFIDISLRRVSSWTKFASKLIENFYAKLNSINIFPIKYLALALGINWLIHYCLHPQFFISLMHFFQPQAYRVVRNVMKIERIVM